MWITGPPGPKLKAGPAADPAQKTLIWYLRVFALTGSMIGVHLLFSLGPGALSDLRNA